MKPRKGVNQIENIQIIHKSTQIGIIPSRGYRTIGINQGVSDARAYQSWVQIVFDFTSLCGVPEGRDWLFSGLFEWFLLRKLHQTQLKHLVDFKYYSNPGLPK